MKRTFSLATVLATVAATAAFAVPDTNAIHEIRAYAPNANIAALNDEQVAAILAVIHSEGSNSEVRARVRALAKVEARSDDPMFQ